MKFSMLREVMVNSLLARHEVGRTSSTPRDQLRGG